MIAVADTTAVTSLMKIGREAILASLFERVLLPGAVQAELLRYHQSIPDWLEIRMVGDRKAVERLTHVLDLGESEAIVLAAEVGADVLLIDERKGRVAAAAKQITCLTLPGLLVLAKRVGVVETVGDILHDLELRGHFRLAHGMKAHLLREVGEPSGGAD